jgi:hypothetical protein
MNIAIIGGNKISINNILGIFLSIVIALYCTQTIAASTPCVTQAQIDSLKGAVDQTGEAASEAALTAVIAQGAAVAADALAAAGSPIPGVNLILLAAAAAANAAAEAATFTAGRLAAVALAAWTAYNAALKLPRCCTGS